VTGDLDENPVRQNGNAVMGAGARNGGVEPRAALRRANPSINTIESAESSCPLCAANTKWFDLLNSALLKLVVSTSFFFA